MTIASELNTLISTKNSIKSAITAKGVSVSDSDSFASYSTKIGQISTVNNQNKTITSNGTYSADNGYTGIGMATVNVIKDKIFNLNCTVNNGIAGNFANSDINSPTVGGFCFGYNSKYFDYCFDTFQIGFTMPQTLSEWEVICGTPSPNKVWGYDGGEYDLIINCHTTADKIFVYGLGLNGLECDYELVGGAGYIIKFVKNDKIYISADNGETFVTLSSTPPTQDFSTMRNTQFGFVADYNASNAITFTGTIDLTKTGFINSNTQKTFMFAE